MSVLSVDHVHFQYNGGEVLTDATFALEKGDYLGLVGPNGSGKTTLIRLLLGFFKPTSGKVSLFGKIPRSSTRGSGSGTCPSASPPLIPGFPPR